jgi:hypothetical protein
MEGKNKETLQRGFWGRNRHEVALSLNIRKRNINNTNSRCNLLEAENSKLWALKIRANGQWADNCRYYEQRKSVFCSNSLTDVWNRCSVKQVQTVPTPQISLALSLSLSLQHDVTCTPPLLYSLLSTPSHPFVLTHRSPQWYQHTKQSFTRILSVRFSYEVKY